MIEETPRPIPQCYWVLPRQFLAGEYPRNIDAPSSQEKIAALVCAGVSAFIDLTQENEGLLPYAQLLEAHQAKGVLHQRFPIQDVSVPHSPAQTTTILDAIDGHLQQGRLVYLHCMGGIGRTGLIVGCWLARHGFQGPPALARLRELWRQCPKSAHRRSPETTEQERYILTWKEGNER